MGGDGRRVIVTEKPVSPTGVVWVPVNIIGGTAIICTVIMCEPLQRVQVPRGGGGGALKWKTGHQLHLTWFGNALITWIQPNKLPVPFIVADPIHSLLMNFRHTRYWSPCLAPETTRDPEFPDSSLTNSGSHSAPPTFTKPYLRSTVTSLMEICC